MFLASWQVRSTHSVSGPAWAPCCLYPSDCTSLFQGIVIDDLKTLLCALVAECSSVATYTEYRTTVAILKSLPAGSWHFHIFLPIPSCRSCLVLLGWCPLLAALVHFVGVPADTHANFEPNLSVVKAGSCSSLFFCWSLWPRHWASNVVETVGVGGYTSCLNQRGYVVARTTAFLLECCIDSSSGAAVAKAAVRPGVVTWEGVTW